MENLKENQIIKWIINHAFILLIVAIVIVLILLLLPSKNNVKFELIGNNLTIYENQRYFEYGYTLSDKTNYHVYIESNVNSSVVGTYTVNYKLFDKKNNLIETKTRQVIVLKDDLKNVTLELNGNSTIYVPVNLNYKELGAKANYEGNDISSNIKINGNVRTDVLGIYEIKYSVTIGNKTKTISRYVNVYNLLIEKNIDYQNRSINIDIISYDFDHALLPNGNIIYEESFDYKYEKSGKNVFEVFTKSGYSKKFEVEVIDADNPVATCNAKIKNNMTEVEITATDDGGISRYVYGSTTYTENTFKINASLTSFTVRVYDNSNNYVDVTCKTRKQFNNNMDEINTPSTFMTCGGDYSKYNSELLNIVNEYGVRTRDAVAASAEYLAKYFPYAIAYSWGGKSVTPGINKDWGCSKHTMKKDDGTLVCTKITGDSSCMYGMDCSGYTSWAYANAGFDKSVIRTSSQSTGMWGNFNASKHKYSFYGNQDKVNLIKPGDIVHTEDHVGIVLGTSDTMLKVANMVGGIKITYLKKSNGASTNNQHSFQNFVLMDEFFEMYGNKE